MSGKYKPVLIRRVSLWWYALALLPILALGWASLTGLVPSLLAPLSLFALFFWIFSFGFAIAGKLKKSPPPDTNP
ncbi:MAG: hypothetical protein ACO1OG_11245 [Devosia sp.]